MEVQLVLQRGRGQTSLVDFAALEVKPSLDQIVGEHVAGGQEVVVLFQGVQGRVEGARHLLDVGVLFGRSS